MQLYDDLEDFGSFDDTVAGDVRDPYPELARMRRDEPVQRLDLSDMPHDENKPIFFVYRYDDVARVLRDNETFSSSIILDFFGDALGKDVMLGMDEPAHRRHRALVAGAFTQRAVARREHDLVGRIAGELVDQFAADGRADLVRQFTFPFPPKVTASLLGLPPEDYPRFQRWSIALLSILTNRERGLAAAGALKRYFAQILAARRAAPRDDLISDLAAAELDGQRLTDDEIFSFLRLLLPAGVETTYRSTGSMLFGLLSHPDQLDAVRADRSLIPQAIEEAVRWEPPLLSITRVAARDTELSGVPIPAGSAVMPMLGAANREAERNPEPDRFDIRRQGRQHISFGHGVHICLGMHLARLEMRVALETLLDRLPGLRLDPDGDDPHIHGQVFRSPTSLPVLFDVAA
ncbi:cytochrome P450 [Parafrankia sp. EUN1f]|uniref:cytochrome P450 n=1 Tax=Parafrankia sp. EUN1f TaxID=102897 RepID=UPI0001C445D5|nr:cytochrome P450 [Parafrankia sp. EUN1f]EFC86721.1 cytochrome P450 [Parafrankia sp. EUN1f]